MRSQKKKKLFFFLIFYDSSEIDNFLIKILKKLKMLVLKKKEKDN